MVSPRYCWDEAQWRGLWADLLALAEGKCAEHMLGRIVRRMRGRREATGSHLREVGTGEDHTIAITGLTCRICPEETAGEVRTPEQFARLTPEVVYEECWERRPPDLPAAERVATPRRLVILDGQQRLTTVCLLLRALADAGAEDPRLAEALFPQARLF